MRRVYKNFITKKEADAQTESINKKFLIKSTNNDLVDKIVEKLKEDFDFKIKDQSYWRIEHQSSGHQWHKDTGSGGGMMWCQVGVSLLLKEGTSGGDTFYGDDINGSNAEKSDRNLYDLVAHTSDEWHMVTPHEGERVVFLMFI